ncbi:LolA family protein [Halorientalis halophila]|uniref:LolA family protein n=1 Tax=Halorientalis halophila TaxID=3108499 RepID=UPI003008C388
MSDVFAGWTRRRALLGVVGLVFVTAGCLGTPGTEVDDPDAVANQVESRYENLEGFQATMVRTLETGDETATARATVTFDKGDRLRIAYHTGPKAGEVTVIDDPSPARVLGGDAVGSSESDASAVYGTLAGDLVRENEVVFEGTETIRDRRTAVFSITPPTDGDASETRPERRVWIDAEHVVPLRIESNWTADGEPVSETIRFENVSLGVPEKRGESAPAPGGAIA